MHQTGTIKQRSYDSEGLGKTSVYASGGKGGTTAPDANAARMPDEGGAEGTDRPHTAPQPIRDGTLFAGFLRDVGGGGIHCPAPPPLPEDTRPCRSIPLNYTILKRPNPGEDIM